MAYATVVVRRTFRLKRCFCNGCVEKLMKIEGIDSIDIDKEQGDVATISATVDPHRVIEELQKSRMSVELLGEEKSPAAAASLHQTIVPRETRRRGVHEKKVKDSTKVKHETNVIEKHPKEEKIDDSGKKKRPGTAPEGVHEKKVKDSSKLKHETNVIEKYPKEKKNVESREEKRLGTAPGDVYEKKVKDSSKLKHEINVIEKHPKKKKNVESGEEKRLVVYEKKVKDSSKLKHETNVIEKHPTEKKNVEPGEGKRLGIKDCKHETVRESNNKWFKCDGCKEKGFGSRYTCDLCDYDFHHECLSRKPKISRDDLFPECIFKFSPSPISSRFCDACGKGIHGYYYKCEAWDLDLHPRCSNLPCKLWIGDKKTVFILCNKVSSKCSWCHNRRHNLATESQIPGWSYVSECEQYSFHVYCVAEMVVHEASKRDAAEENIAKSEISKALKTVDLQLVAKKSNKPGEKWTKYCKKVWMFFRVIVGIFLGDPTVVLAATVVELFSK